ncbi:MAG: hypothetical protein L6Q54_11685 [Leptospiraceae bacterium]|nr:hypothetical protein [Leptospiraceae bacterium]
MIFKAKNYSVEFEIDGKVHALPVFSADSIFKSQILDEKRDQSKAIYEEYIEFNRVLLALGELEKRARNEEEEKYYNSFDTQELLEKSNSIRKRIRKANYEFVKEAIRDHEKYIDIIDTIRPEHYEGFFTAIERAGLGITDIPEKKNPTTSIISQNSKGGDIRRKRSKNGLRINSTTRKK